MTHPLEPYFTPEERESAATALADALGAEVLTYGHSVQGRPLRVVRVPCARARAPKVLITGNIHGVEWISGQVAMGVLRALPHHRQVQTLHERSEIWVVPCLNPDGYAHTFAERGHGRAATLRTNANGVDLNRNFPIPAGHVRRPLPGAGSTKPGAATYVGRAPLSEPEAAALDELMHAQNFAAGINVHSFMGKVIPPRVLQRHHAKGYKALAAALRSAQPHARYGRLSSPIFDTFTGELEDHQHHAHHMWSVCLETFSLAASFRQHLRAPSLFWRFNPRDPARWLDNDVPAIAAFLCAALQTPFTPQTSAPQG